MPLGESREINAAWIRFPELEVTPTRQAYHRLHEKQYRYRNLASGFTALIDVDDEGLPTEYAGIWQRVAHGVAAPLSVSAEFARALISDAPSTELGNAAEAFGWLIGGWAAQIRDFDPDGRVRHGSGEWWFSWALEGRAVQDVWISPPRSKRTSDHGKPPDQSSANNRYGTTVRWFELKDGVWRIVFVNPVSGAIYNLRESGKVTGLSSWARKKMDLQFDGALTRSGPTVSFSAVRNVKRMGSGGSVPNSNCKGWFEKQQDYERITVIRKHLPLFYRSTACSAHLSRELSIRMVAGFAELAERKENLGCGGLI
jgi:hypothetical protein